MTERVFEESKSDLHLNQPRGTFSYHCWTKVIRFMAKIGKVMLIKKH